MHACSNLTHALTHAHTHMRIRIVSQEDVKDRESVYSLCKELGISVIGYCFVYDKISKADGGRRGKATIAQRRRERLAAGGDAQADQKQQEEESEDGTVSAYHALLSNLLRIQHSHRGGGGEAPWVMVGVEKGSGVAEAYQTSDQSCQMTYDSAFVHTSSLLRRGEGGNGEGAAAAAAVASLKSSLKLSTTSDITLSSSSTSALPTILCLTACAIQEGVGDWCGQEFNERISKKRKKSLLGLVQQEQEERERERRGGNKNKNKNKNKKTGAAKKSEDRLLEALTDFNILLYFASNLDRQASDAIKRCAKSYQLTRGSIQARRRKKKRASEAAYTILHDGQLLGDNVLKDMEALLRGDVD